MWLYVVWRGKAVCWTAPLPETDLAPIFPKTFGLYVVWRAPGRLPPPGIRPVADRRLPVTTGRAPHRDIDLVRHRK
jgi:hypothetical protein